MNLQTKFPAGMFPAGMVLHNISFRLVLLKQGQLSAGISDAEVFIKPDSNLFYFVLLVLCLECAASLKD